MSFTPLALLLGLLACATDAARVDPPQPIDLTSAIRNAVADAYAGYTARPQPDSLRIASGSLPDLDFASEFGEAPLRLVTPVGRTWDIQLFGLLKDGRDEKHLEVIVWPSDAASARHGEVFSVQVVRSGEIWELGEVSPLGTARGGVLR